MGSFGGRNKRKGTNLNRSSSRVHTLFNALTSDIWTIPY